MKKRMLSIMLTLAMVLSFFTGMTLTASAEGVTIQEFTGVAFSGTTVTLTLDSSKTYKVEADEIYSHIEDLTYHQGEVDKAMAMIGQPVLTSSEEIENNWWYDKVKTYANMSTPYSGHATVTGRSTYTFEIEERTVLRVFEVDPDLSWNNGSSILRPVLSAYAEILFPTYAPIENVPFTMNWNAMPSMVDGGTILPYNPMDPVISNNAKVMPIAYLAVKITADNIKNVVNSAFIEMIDTEGNMSNAELLAEYKKVVTEEEYAPYPDWVSVGMLFFSENDDDYLPVFNANYKINYTDEYALVVEGMSDKNPFPENVKVTIDGVEIDNVHRHFFWDETCTYISAVYELGKLSAFEDKLPAPPQPETPPAHEHSYTYTSNNNGTHNGACDCEEDAITNQACTYVDGVCDKCGYVKPVTPPAPPTVNVPVSNDANKVDVQAEISGNDATIKPLDADQIDKLVGSGNASGDVVIDLSKLNKIIDTAGIPKATLEAIVNATSGNGNNIGKLVIKLSTAELKFDDTALSTIVNQANGDVVKFNFDDVGFDRLNETQKEAIKDMDVRKGYEAYITVNDERIGNFNGGNVEIIVPYDVPEGENVDLFSVWYVKDDGTLEKQQSTYDGKEKCFIVTHFSDYIIVYTAGETHDFSDDWKNDANEHWKECDCGEVSDKAVHTDENKDGRCDVCDYQISDAEGGCRGGIGIAIIIIAVVIIGGVVVFIILRKRNQDKNNTEKTK